MLSLILLQQIAQLFIIIFLVGFGLVMLYSGNSLCHVLELHQHGGSACHRNLG